MAIESSKPKKQRKYHYCKPLHKKQDALSGHLSNKLRKELGIRSIALRKGDKVKVMRGKHSKEGGKITAVNYRKCYVFIEKLIRKKADGTEMPVPVHASNVMVVDIEASDSKRMKRAKKKPVEKAGKEEKPKKKRAIKKKKEREKHGEKGRE